MQPLGLAWEPTDGRALLPRQKNPLPPRTGSVGARFAVENLGGDRRITGGTARFALLRLPLRPRPRLAASTRGERRSGGRRASVHPYRLPFQVEPLFSTAEPALAFSPGPSSLTTLDSEMMQLPSARRRLGLASDSGSQHITPRSSRCPGIWILHVVPTVWGGGSRLDPHLRMLCKRLGSFRTRSRSNSAEQRMGPGAPQTHPCLFRGFPRG